MGMKWVKRIQKKTNRLWYLTLSWQRPLSYSNQSIDLQSKSKDWFLYDNGLRHERVKYPIMNSGIQIRFLRQHLKDVKISSVQFCYGSSDIFGVIYECL